MLDPTWDTFSDTWPATDGLGRELPLHDDVGDPRPDRFVGMFYFVWHGQHSPTGPWDVSRILAEHPEAVDDSDHPAWGPIHHTHHWGESAFGYYRAEDEWVHRRNAELLTDAGVDAIFLDVTNQHTYQEPYRAILRAWRTVQANGGTTPKLAFLTPFWDPAQVVADLYFDLYRSGASADQVFEWKGKPIILADPSLLKEVDWVTVVDASGWPVDAPIEPGSTVGQSVRIGYSFSAIGCRIKSSAPDAAVTITLRDAATGTIVASVRATGLPGHDVPQPEFNAPAAGEQFWLELDGPAPAGDFLVELSDAVGGVSWDSSDLAHSSAVATVDGSVVPGCRTLYARPAEGDLAEILDFFTFRAPEPSYFVGPSFPGQWSWLEVYPQHGFPNREGVIEQASVGVAQNAVGGRLGALSEKNSLGRSSVDGVPATDGSRSAEGLNYQQQWDRAIELDPEIVFVTGWNEWVMGRFAKGEFQAAEGNVILVDQFDLEHSRDIEPMAGGHGDAYYYQTVANIRRFKGARAGAVASAPATIDFEGDAAQWRDVAPEFRDHRGETAPRDHPGSGTAGPYVNATGRNDIVATQVTRDSENIVVRVRTAAALSPASDPDWMLLLLDVDGDHANGWEGFDFVVNRIPPSNGRAVLEASSGGWNWTRVAEVRIRILDDELWLELPRAVLGIGADPISIDLKWLDNPQSSGDANDATVNGDAAPPGRFRYRYSTGDVVS
jgi:hypothetical protein